MMSSAQVDKCWITLITNDSYLPGVIILARSLDTHKSKYPLLVQYTSSLSTNAINALKAEADITKRLILHKVDLLLPRKDQENIGSVAERFKDTFTKLRAFDVYQHGYTKAVFLDADMAVFRCPDDVFDVELPDHSWIGANHACVCNHDRDPWAPDSWRAENCAYTTLTSSETVVPRITPDARPTYHALNSGMFLYYPSEKLWHDLLDFFNTTDRLKTYQFPDQDFLADYFRNKWLPMSWKYNAIKTMRYWHPNIWHDDKVVVLHYIVDKPWSKKVGVDGVAGYLGRDGVSHSWWWSIYKDWHEKSTNQHIEIIEALTA